MQSSEEATHDGAGLESPIFPNWNVHCSTERILVDHELIRPSADVRSRHEPDNSPTPSMQNRSLRNFVSGLAPWNGGLLTLSK